MKISYPKIWLRKIRGKRCMIVIVGDEFIVRDLWERRVMSKMLSTRVYSRLTNRRRLARPVVLTLWI